MGKDGMAVLAQLMVASKLQGPARIVSLAVL